MVPSDYEEGEVPGEAPQPTRHGGELVAAPATEEYGEWREVPGFDGESILVSSRGWVKTKYAGGGGGGGAVKPLGKPRSGMDFRGHKVVTLSNKKYKICNLVAITFIGPQPSTAHAVVHKDGNTSNNSVANLSWSTGHTVDHGEWRAVPGMDPSKVLVSSLGWVRTQRQGGRDHEGAVRPLGPPQLGHETVAGRMVVKACDHKHCLVHRLVALAFCGAQPTEEHTVDHIDRNPKNNSASNLRWATKAEQRANQSVPAARYKVDESQSDLVVDGEPELWKEVNRTLRVSSMGRVERKRGSNWQGKATPPIHKQIGYVTVGVDGKKEMLHRVIKLAFHGPSNDPTKITVDHINRVRSDNRLSNLRWASYSEQSLNQVRKA